MNNTSFGAGCEMVESVNTTKSYSMPLKGNEIYPVSSTNLSETQELIENEAIISGSPNNEIKSTVISPAVDNNGEIVEKITATDTKSKDEGSLNNKDTEIRLGEEGDTGNLNSDFTQKTVDYG